jgi:hypothetical protein
MKKMLKGEDKERQMRMKKIYIRAKYKQKEWVE